jgi:hypothetical protein
VDERESWGEEGLVALYLVTEAWFKCFKNDLQSASKTLEAATNYRMSDFVHSKWTWGKKKKK